MYIQRLSMGLYRYRRAIPFSANGDFIQVARLQSYAGSRYFTSNIYLLAQRKRNFDIWKNKKDAKDMLLFSLIGMLFMQYGYFLAIGHSNAATATVLQYLAPVMIVIYVSIRYHKMPSFFEFAAVLCALLGTFLLATHGNVKSLSISPLALF